MTENRIGIMGGSFDPIHNAHIKLAEYAYKELNLEKVIFIPAYIQPFKKDRKVTDEVHRVRMLKLALMEYKEFEVSDIEIQMKGESYTARTLEALSKTYSNMVFILGADSYETLDKWYHPEQIFKYASIACAHRDGSTPEHLNKLSQEYGQRYNGTTYFLHMPDTDISSTDIRRAICEGKDVTNIIPRNVFEYIRENGLYE